MAHPPQYISILYNIPQIFIQLLLKYKFDSLCSQRKPYPFFLHLYMLHLIKAIMSPSSPQLFAGDKSLAFLLASILFVSLNVMGEVNSRREYSMSVSSAHAVAESSCSTTLYPELCYSSMADSLNDHKISIRNTKDVIFLALNITIDNARRNYAAIKNLIAHGEANLTEREKTALHDCLVAIDQTVDELRAAFRELEEYPLKKSLRKHADDLRTLLSSAMTNQETCLDGFSHGKDDRHERDVLVGGKVLRVEKLCSNLLAMITNMTHTDIIEEERIRLSGGRKLSAPEGRGRGSWPEWLSAGDRRLLQSSSVTADVVVAADGSGDFKTVTAAVDAAPEKSSKRYVIRIKAGVYRENVEVPKKKTNIMFLGDGRTSTIITGSRNVVDGSTTFKSATVAAVGEKFLARDITFENTAGPSKHQAVALRVGSDLSAFHNCDILAYQDTLYVHSNRQFFGQCLIAGTVDFIFGNAAVVIQNSTIHARLPDSGQQNMVTAQGRTDPNQNTGIVIQNCKIGATSDLQPVREKFPTFLGRPWKMYSRTVILQSEISDVIQPVGWHEWDGDFGQDTLFYGEYKNTGAGAGTSGRVKWKGFKVITSATEAQSYTAESFIAGGGWLNSTGFPFALGL
ncbi:pectinesterase [Henckelia pumila]|uniref:pectinesterase n=1 Tax=Henckelia pumila TaxID=405737 RepID=UPI003C6DF5AE